MVGYAPSSFADLVFAGERIEASLKKGKFDHPALMNEKTGANEEDENEEGTHVVAAIPTWQNFPPVQQCHRSACNDPPRRYGIHTLILDNFIFFIKRTPLIFAYENRSDFVTT